MSRHAGLIVPLSSARSRTGWGIGEIADLVPLSAWLADAGFDRLMVLPLGTGRPGDASPYASTSTLAIDPIYITMADVAEFRKAGGEAALGAGAAELLRRAREAPTVEHDAVREAKSEALALAFGVFVSEEWEQLTPRASALAAYIARERWWLDDYALFQALAARMPGRSWREWPEPLRDRDMRALDQARRDLQREVLRHQYEQWTAESQWQRACGAARRRGVHVIGDLPFVGATDSADVWARAGEYLPDVTIGCPPDQFTPHGQDWGLPAYRWDVMAATGYDWFRERVRRMAALFDGLRVDHLVGLYRTYLRPPGDAPHFVPDDEEAQRRQGEAVLGVLRAGCGEIIAEDLGLVPDWVRASLAAMDVPGCRVLRWERDWQASGAPFLDPHTYPRRSAAMTGTHDTEPMAGWWDSADADDRAAFMRLVDGENGQTNVGADTAFGPWTADLRDRVLELVYGSASDHVFATPQDLFGWRDRINTPGTVGPHNWTWCLPWPVDGLDGERDARERADFLRRLAAATGRTTLVREEGAVE